MKTLDHACLACSLVSVVSAGWVGSASFIKRHAVAVSRFDAHRRSRLHGAVNNNIMTSESDDDGSDVQEHTTEAIDLQLHTRRKSPAQTLSDLSEACGRLGVDAWDVYGDFDSDEERSYLRRFEAEVAHHFGKEDGVFCLSGGMAQSIVLAINAKKRTLMGDGKEDSDVEKKAAFACHPTSHLLLHEKNHFSELLGMDAVVIDANNSDGYDPKSLMERGCCGMEPMRSSHVRDLFASLDGSASSESALTHPNNMPVDSVDISTLILELPHREIGGKLTAWDEVEEIARLCKERGIGYHCDGARIFEASAGYGHKSVKETAKPFATIYVSFYKGLGAVSGAMLLGDAAFCAEARVWLRRFGGNLYSVLPYAISSWDGFRSNCLKEGARMDHIHGERFNYDCGIFESRRKKLARVVELLRADTSIAPIVQFDPPVPEVNMVHGYLRMPHETCMAALEKAERSTGIRVLYRVRSCSSSNVSGGVGSDEEFGCRFELTMGESNSLIEDNHFVDGWKAFAQVVKGEYL